MNIKSENRPNKPMILHLLVNGKNSYIIIIMKVSRKEKFEMNSKISVCH